MGRDHKWFRLDGDGPHDKNKPMGRTATPISDTRANTLLAAPFSGFLLKIQIDAVDDATRLSVDLIGEDLPEGTRLVAVFAREERMEKGDPIKARSTEVVAHFQNGTVASISAAKLLQTYYGRATLNLFARPPGAAQELDSSPAERQRKQHRAEPTAATAGDANAIVPAPAAPDEDDDSMGA
jgi:hypothetical protein